jgi:hypothetical protein
MFHADRRGLGMSVFAAAPFLGPVIGEYRFETMPLYGQLTLL